jgi:bacillithiol biosynthesis deacetylase BshB1
MKLDIVVLAAHPDDAELACSGTILHHLALGKKVGIIDLTQGELGTRGTAQTRKQESQEASKIMNITIRENLELPDGFLENIPKYQLKIIQAIRKYQPEIVLANAIKDRHTDHAKASILAKEATFLSGLRKIITFDENEKQQQEWRPKNIYHYIQDYFIEPDFVVDITPYWQTKMQAIKAFKTQFFTQENDNNEPQTPISSPQFIYFLEARAREMGRTIGVEFGEGFTTNRPIGIKNLFEVF